MSNSLSALSTVAAQLGVPALSAVANNSSTVSAHFLISKFGTGSNFVDATSGDPDVTFFGPDPSLNFSAADLGPQVTAAYHWHLDPVR